MMFDWGDKRELWRNKRQLIYIYIYIYIWYVIYMFYDICYGVLNLTLTLQRGFDPNYICLNILRIWPRFLYLFNWIKNLTLIPTFDIWNLFACLWAKPQWIQWNFFMRNFQIKSLLWVQVTFDIYFCLQHKSSWKLISSY